MISVLRDKGLSGLIGPDAAVEVWAEGFQFTEGPLWLPDGGLLFQDLKAERTYRVSAEGGLEVLREKTGAANGQTWDRGGRVVFCEQNGRRVSRMGVDGGGVETVAETYRGMRLNSPNDIVARSDGTLYFTDPPYGAPADRPMDFQGVYALGVDGESRLLVDDFEKPNGLAFSPDERVLYVCDTARYHVRAFPVRDDGTLEVEGSGELARFDPGVAGGPDGMKVDRDGRLYVAVALGIWVLEPDGSLLGIIELPKRPSNLAWMGPGGDGLAITMVDQVLRVGGLGVAGCAPAFQPRG